jgi:aryl-alcohol dehydrogenase
MEITAAVARSVDTPFELQTLELKEPGPDELLVKIHASGVCHTDAAVKEQHIPAPLPMVLGHEGAGVVESVGANVQGYEVGDHVLMSFDSCGICPACSEGSPTYCANFVVLNILGDLITGTTRLSDAGQPTNGSFFGQSSFATHAVVTPRNLVKIDKDLPLEILAPLGCGVQTGMGTIMNTLSPSASSSLAVFGTGSVGLSGVMAARITECSKIIAVDIKQSRLDLAAELGATHTIDGSDPAKVVAQIQEITGGGVNFSFDTTGVPAVARAALDAMCSQGVLALVAAPPGGTELSIDIPMTVTTGKTIRGVIEGDAVPSEFIPRLIEYYRAGQLPLEKMITTYPFEQINQAFDDVETGKTVKPVLVM